MIVPSTTPRRSTFIEGATVMLVAAAFAALAYSSGGYSTQLTAAVTVGVWWLVLLALVTRLLPGRTIPGTAIAAGACLAGYAALTALSMIWADDAGRTFVALVRVSGYLGLFVLVVLTSGRTRARSWLVGLAVGMVVVVVGSLASRFDPSLFGGADRALFNQLPSADGRLSYPIGYWNGLGASIALGMVMLVWLGVEARSRLGRAAATGALPLFGVALYLTGSRGGLTAVIVAALVLLIVFRRRAGLIGAALIGGAGVALLVFLASSRNDLVHGLTTSAAYAQGREMAAATVLCGLAAGLVRYFADAPLARLTLPTIRPRVVIATVVVIGAVAIAIVGPADTYHQFVDPHDVGGANGQFISASGTGRYQFWSAAFDAFESKPVLGIGAGNYQLWWNLHPGIPAVVLNAHSLYFETLAELGIVGLCLLLAFFGVVIAAGVRQAAERRGFKRDDGAVAVALAVLAGGLASAAFDWTWQLPAVFAPVIVVAALLCAPVAERVRAIAPVARENKGAAANGARRSQFGLGVATILLAWAAVWVAGDQLIASVKLGDSRNAFDQGQFDTAAQDARDAAAIQPWSPDPQLQLALVEKQRGNLVGAQDAIHKAVDLAPDDWRGWLVAAEISAAAQRPALAQFALSRARQLSPTHLKVVLGS